LQVKDQERCYIYDMQTYHFNINIHYAKWRHMHVQ